MTDETYQAIVDYANRCFSILPNLRGRIVVDRKIPVGKPKLGSNPQDIDEVYSSDIRLHPKDYLDLKRRVALKRRWWA